MAAEHLEAALAELDDPLRRAELRLQLGRVLHDFGRLEEGFEAFGPARGRLDGGDLAVDVESWWLTSAMLLPDRAPEAHRHVADILARAETASTRAERVLASKALIMSVYRGTHRERLVPLAGGSVAKRSLLDEGADLRRSATSRGRSPTPTSTSSPTRCSRAGSRRAGARGR